MSERVHAERQVMQEHFKAMEATDPGHLVRVRALSETLPPMDDACRLSLTIPAFDEAARIGRTLSVVLEGSNGAELKQATKSGDILDPRTYEVVVFNDWAEDARPDSTADVVRTFMSTHPQMPIRLIATPTPRQQMSVGYARRMLQDVTCFRSLERSVQEGPLYIASDDADIDGYDPEAFDTFIKYLDSHPEEAGASMRNERNPLVLRHVPHLLLQYRISRAAFSLLSASDFDGECREQQVTCSRYPMAHGIGLVYTARDQLAAGGFRDNECAEDFDLWRRLFWSKVSADTPGWKLRTLPTIVVSSPRRQLASFVQDEERYVNGAFTRLNDAVRSEEQELLEAAIAAWEADPTSCRNATERQLNIVAARMREHGPLNNYAAVRAGMRRLMKLLGLADTDYSCEPDGSVRVYNWQQAEFLAANYTPSRHIARCLLPQLVSVR